MGNKELDRYIMIPETKIDLVSKAISYFDGNHSLAWIEDRLYKQEGKKLDVMGLYRLLIKSGLVEGAGTADLDRGEFDKLSFKLISRDISRLCEFIKPSISTIFPALVIAGAIIIAAGVICLIDDPGMLTGAIAYKLGGSYFIGFLLFGLAILPSYFLHEVAHGIAAMRYELIPRRFEICIYLGCIPCILMKIPGIYTLKPKDRIIIWSAGIYTNLIIASSLSVLCRAFHLSPLLDRIIAKVLFANLFMVATNLIPFLPTDGYWILTTILKRPNVRSESWNEFKKWISCRENRFNGFLAVYFSLCLVTLILSLLLSAYRGNFIRILLFIIALFIFLKKRLQALIQKIFERKKDLQEASNE